MQGNVAFLMKDVVLLSVSVYLLQQDLTRAVAAEKRRVSCEVDQSSAMAHDRAVAAQQVGT
jgi:hypothetical protein